MAILLQADDTNEYFHDTDYELLGNQNLYGVIGGCAVTYDGSNLTVDIGAGTILHNGTVVQVAEQLNVVTIVPDSSNELWAYIGVDSSGTGQIVHGDAAASSTTEPTKPENGDYVLLAMVKVDAGLTVANNASLKLDKRVPVTSFAIRKTATQNLTQSNTTLEDVTQFLFWMNASEAWHIHIKLIENTGTTPDIHFAFSVPSGASGSGDVTYYTSTPTWLNSPWADITAEFTGVDGGASNEVVHIDVVGVNSTTAGKFQFQAAQGTSDASATDIIVNSVMWCRRLS